MWVPIRYNTSRPVLFLDNDEPKRARAQAKGHTTVKMGNYVKRIVKRGTMKTVLEYNN